MTLAASTVPFVFPDPAMLFDPETVLISLCILLAMGGVAWRDARTFEIDLTLLGVAAMSFVTLVAMQGDVVDVTSTLAVAGLLVLVTGLTHAIRPARIGQGDIWLMGFIGLVSGPAHIAPVLAVFCVLCVLTSAFYSRARGKRLFRSLFPVALPGMGAAGFALLLLLQDIARDPVSDRTGFAPDQGAHLPGMADLHCGGPCRPADARTAGTRS